MMALGWLEMCQNEASTLRPSQGPAINCLGDLPLISLGLNELCNMILKSLLLKMWQISRDRKAEGSKTLKKIFLFAYFLFILPFTDMKMH